MNNDKIKFCALPCSNLHLFLILGNEVDSRRKVVNLKKYFFLFVQRKTLNDIGN